jgi:CBS domain-containing protein
MTTTIREIMNPDLFYVRASDSVEMARDGIISLGITAAPVLDDQLHAVGIVSLRDLLDEPRNERVETRMSSPVASAGQEDSVDLAAQRFAHSQLRHLVVLDREQRTVGMVSAADVLRSVLGVPPKHPAAFPVLEAVEAVPNVGWTVVMPLELDHVLEQAPAGPGVFALMFGDEEYRSLVWAESSENVRGRLIDILATPLDLEPVIRAWMERELFRIRFCVAPIADPELRERAVHDLRRGLRHF